MKNKITKLAGALLISAGSVTIASAQVSQKIGSNPFNISSSAALEIESTTKGFLPPRMTDVERNAIVAPATGLIIYNTVSNLLEINIGTSLVPNWKSATVINPSILTQTADYTALETDYTVLCDASTAGFTLTLPAASAATGRVYVISKIDNTENLLTFSPALNLTKDITVTNLNYSRSFRVQSDGTVWNIID